MSKDSNKKTSAGASTTVLPELSAEEQVKVTGGRRGRGPGRHSN
jgi:hypothetical protein